MPRAVEDVVRGANHAVVSVAAVENVVAFVAAEWSLPPLR
jgi:hypothetical protein